MKTSKLDFQYFPAFAAFLLNDHLEDFVRVQLCLSKEVNLPLLAFFETIGEKKLMELTMHTTTELLTYLINNKAAEQIEGSFKNWMANQLPVLSREQIVTEDITLINYIRRQSFLHFIPLYTADVPEMMNLIREIDLFLLESETTSTNGYIRLLKNRINEEIYFKENIINTTPGLVYVFDLLERKMIYSNAKTSANQDDHSENLNETTEFLVEKKFHPDDLQKAIEHRKLVVLMQDKEIKTFEYRAKEKNGTYRWFRAYESVFRRTAEGKALQLIGIAIDIQSEKQTEQQLSFREGQLLEAQELARLGSYDWDLVKQTSETTPEISKILELGQLPLEDFLFHVHISDRLKVEAALKTAMEDSGLYDCEFRYLINGKEKVLWSRGVVIFDENGKPLNMRGTIMDVTERHAIIQQLKTSEEMYKQAQAITHIGNYVWEPDANKLSWSDELYRIYELEFRSALTSEGIGEWHHPEDTTRIKNEIGHAVTTTGNFDFHYRILMKDKRIKMLRTRGEVVTDYANHKKILGTVQDVTEQYHIEQQLRENQNFIQKIADATPSIIATYNINTGKYRFISKGIAKLLGYDAVMAMEKGVEFFISIIHPDDLEPMMTKNARALQEANDNGAELNNIIIDWEYRMLHADGKYRWFHTYGTIFDRNSAGKVENVLNISVDINDKIETEKKLAEQELFIKHIADASPTVLYLFDSVKGRIVYVNREIESVLGYSPNEMIAMGDQVIENLYHPEDRSRISERLHQYNDRGNPQTLFQFECRMKHRNGDWRWLLIREIVFKRDKEGRILEVLGAALDISRRKEIETILFQKTRELEQSNAGLEEFAYVASHDLKEPLRKISTFGDRLLVSQKDQLNEDGKNYLDKIIHSSRRMQQMINDLLSVSMISGEKNFERFSLKLLLDDAIQTLEYKIEEQKALLEIEPLPEAFIIPSQFRQIFQNLLSNSLKFVRPGVQPVIKVTYKYLKPGELPVTNIAKANRYLQLTFSDNGIGFEKEFADKIFAIFQRLHNKNEYEGTGIGLAICKKIAENHSGAIFATAAPGEGARLNIIIPV